MSSSNRTAGRLKTWALRALVTGALLAPVVIAGQIPFGTGTDTAVLRLALRTVHTRLEVCRELTEEELQRRPVHMRQPTVCEGISPTYRLTVVVDGMEVLTAEGEPGGLRGDRPLILDHEVAVTPGRRRIEVTLEPAKRPGLDAETRAALDQIPHYRLEQVVDLVAGRITLILLDQDTGELIAYEPGN